MKTEKQYKERDERKRGEIMLNIDKVKEQEIERFVSIVKQIDLPDIKLLMRDANTLLMRKQEAEERERKMAG